MPAVYENLGVRFLYPENWSVVDEERQDWPRSVTLQSPGTSFWTLLVYPPQQATGPMIDHVVDSIREMYDELEVLEGGETLAAVPTSGVDICFFYLDLLVEAKIRVLVTPSATLLWHYQAESKEFDAMEPVFHAIATSLLQTQVALPK